MQVIENIPISIKNQYRLLNLLAEGYKSLGKALMEYIDNSFDSADDFFGSKNAYGRKVEINVVIDRAERKISIKDNCEGMNTETLKGLANSINDSEKKRREQNRPWVNGQFGLGAHAFRFFAQKLLVVTKRKNGNQMAILIDKDDPDAHMVHVDRKDLGRSGTLIEICDIDKTHIKNLKPDELKLQIETYFEMLLRRNVDITVTDDNLQALCVPFDYEDVNGLTIQKEITSWKQGSAKVSVLEGDGIKVFLKVCANKLDRHPFFSRKGRRVNLIASMDSFISKTRHRKKVWENYYLTGYIEVGENLEPVITRDDFKGGKGFTQTRSGIYEEIVKLEDEIYDSIETINKNRSDETLKDLGKILTDILSNISNEEDLRLRYESKGGKNMTGEWTQVSPDPESKDEYEVGKMGASKGKNRKNVIKARPNQNSHLFGKKVDGEKQGMRIDFNTLPVTADEDRASYGDGVITIFASHPDFVGRRSGNELEQTRVTTQLINYIATVISGEYKEVFYKQKKLEPARKTILDEQINFIFLFEQKMERFINQPLDLLGKFVN